MVVRLRPLLILALVLALGAPAVAAAPDPGVLEGARAQVAAGDLKGAIATLETYVPAHREDAAAARLLGDLYFRVPDYRAAETTYKALIARDPNDKETHNRLGSLYAALDRVDEAIAEFNKSLPTRGGFVGLVEAHRRSGDLPAFERTIRMHAEANPLDAGALYNYAQVLRVERRYADALPLFQHIRGLRPSDCGAEVDVANDLLDLQRVDEAMGVLRTCLARDPKYYPALVDLGEAYLEKNDNAKARPYFLSALAVRAEGSEALVDLGYIEDLAGRWKDAVAYYLRAMQAEPLQSEAYIDLGYDYNEHGLFSLAEATFLKGLSVSPDDGRLHYMLGVTYNVQGKVALARAQYEIAIRSGEDIVVRAARDELALLPRG